MASTSDLENQKHQGKSLEISDTKEIFLPSGGTNTETSLAASLNNQKNGSHKYGGIYPLGGIATVAMAAAADLKNMITNMTRHLCKSRKRKTSLSQEVVSRLWQKPHC